MLGCLQKKMIMHSWKETYLPQSKCLLYEISQLQQILEVAKVGEDNMILNGLGSICELENLDSYVSEVLKPAEK